MKIKSKTPSDDYRDGWERIFGKKKKPVARPPKEAKLPKKQEETDWLPEDDTQEGSTLD